MQAEAVLKRGLEKCKNVDLWRSYLSWMADNKRPAPDVVRIERSTLRVCGVL